MHAVSYVPWILLLCVSSYSLAWGSNGKSQRRGILAYADSHQHGITEHGVKDQLKLEFRGYIYKAARVVNSVKTIYKKMLHSVV